MNRDPIDDCGKPFAPETPEAFFQRGEEAFQLWWSELDPPGSRGGLEFDYESARAVWAAAYEHNTDPILLVYDSAAAHAEGAHATGEMQLACVVHRHHHGNISLPRRDFTSWVAEHEDHIRYEYSEQDEDADADMLTVWIDHAGQSPSASEPIKRPPPTSSENVRARADKHFDEWWTQLTPAASVTLMGLDRDTAQMVWREAFAKLWEDLEVVHDSAKAYAEVVAETARLELAYIIDRFHNGALSVAVNDVMEYWDEKKYVLQRNRTEEAILLRVLRVDQDRGS